MMHKTCSASLRLFFCVQQSRRSILSSAFPDLTIPRISFGKYLFQNANSVREKKAVIHSEDDRFLTYGDLMKGSQSLASALIKANHGHPPVAMAFLKNCPEYLFLYAAAGFHGATLSTADSNLSSSDLANQINHSEAQFIFTDLFGLSKVMEAIPQCSNVKKVILTYGSVPGEYQGSQLIGHLDSYLHDNGSALGDYNAVSDGWAKTTIFLPFSSGTTGLPKGVQLSHTNIVANLEQINFMLTTFPENTILSMLPMYHIYGLVCIASLGLQQSGTVITVPQFTFPSFINNISKYKITTLPMVPPLIHVLNQQCGIFPDIDLTSVNRVTIGAAPLDAHSEKLFLKNYKHQNPNMEVLQGYGMTESSPAITIIKSKTSKPGSSGQLVPNMKVRVVSVKTGADVGPNEEGELLVQGPNVMLGYLKNEAANKETFVDGWMKTGDLVRYDEEGFFFVEDRLKELIKYKGRQVAPAELEALLLTHPHVMECAVVGKKDQLAGELPTAFVTLAKTVQATESLAEEIQNFINEKVPHYKHLRGGVLFVDSIPKSAAGKILRRKLRETLS